MSATAQNATPSDGDEAELGALLARVASRDGRALGAFYERSRARVYGLILGVLRNPADAEEVVGDLYLQVWERAGDFRPERGSVSAWLKTLAWSRAVDRQRRGRRHAREVGLPPEDSHPEAEPEWSSDYEARDAESMLMAWSSANAVAHAFQALSEVQRRILTLSFHQDMSHQDIARQTGLPLGTIKSHARRGLAALRAELGAGGRDEV